MLRYVIPAILACISVFSADLVEAGDRETLGHGRLVNNDMLGDFQDRWQTGSVASSRVKGYGWDGVLPARPFDILEYRLGTQVIAPENMRSPVVGDRPFATGLSLGLHTHFAKGATEIALGADIVFTGPQNGLGDFQTAFHDAIGVKPASPSVLDAQVGNGTHPTLVAEAGREYRFRAARVRPFAELRWGVETLARAGFDITFGEVTAGDLMVRDPVTGQRYRTVTQKTPGLGFVLGADIAQVADSAFLPSASGVSHSETRSRVRSGVHWQGEKHAVFYGVTWLSEEFDAQPNGQFVGSLRLNFDF